jgi:putative transposase
MPYNYRALTPAEREDVVRQRRERGFPLHAPPHPFRHSAYYLITAANYEHMAIMDSSERRTEFEGLLLEAMHGIDAGINAWVILPNHYHILLSVKALDSISGALNRLHGRTARTWNAGDGRTGTRRVWYRFSDRMIRDEKHYYRALNYIHANPVKHGYASKADEWPWSSYLNYVNEHGRDWVQEKWKTYRPGDFGKGWDED